MQECDHVTACHKSRATPHCWRWPRLQASGITVPLDKAAIDATDAIVGNLRAVFVRVEVTKQ
jgi:hypothetical protein